MGKEKITHEHLINVISKSIYRHPNNRFSFTYVIKEMKTQCITEPDVFAFNSSNSIQIEVKISRADFKRDFKKPVSLIGNKRYYFTPPDLISISELPEGWGLLEYDSFWSGGIFMESFLEKKQSDHFHDNHYDRMLMYSIIRRNLKYGIY